MPTYKEVVDCFASKGCKLLNTEEEFKQMIPVNGNYKFKYIASCDHKHEVFYKVFKYRNTGVVCPSCKAKENGKASKEKKEDKLENIKIEKQCFEYLFDKLNVEYDIIKAFNGCKADLMFKPKNIEEDSWVGIQLKSILHKNNGYSFHNENDAKDCLILCMCLEDKKIWIFPSEDINNITKISIGLKTSKYDKYEVDNLIEKFKYYYENTKKFDFETLDTPLNTHHQREKLFCQYREEKINIIKFKNYEMENFNINNLKIKEKLGIIKNNNSFMFTLHKSNGLLDGKQLFKSYAKDENDFYWLNCPNKKHFYVIPQDILIEHGYIGLYNKKIYFYVNPTKDENWKKDYLFDYDNVDDDRLLKLLNL